jgi:hypothetical protein
MGFQRQVLSRLRQPPRSHQGMKYGYARISTIDQNTATLYRMALV